MNTIIYTLVVTTREEGKEPEITHTVTVNGQAVECPVALISVGNVSGVFLSGVTDLMPLRQIALLAGSLADRAQDAVIGAVIDHIGKLRNDAGTEGQDEVPAQN